MLHKNLEAVIPLILLSILVWPSCDSNKNQEIPHPVSLENLTGVIQKGPFMNGTSINVAELNEYLFQTGKNFTTQTMDNRGSFELKNIELSTQFVELKADGFYFNEISDAPSSARLILYALSDLTDKNTLNVNMISHLEKDRIYQLVSEGVSFSNAKRQAQQEVLGIFSIEKPDIRESELLDITQDGDDHAILLAISVILQGHRSVAELSGLLADIVSDYREDGSMNDASAGSALMNHAVLLDLPAIRQNLEDLYAEAGVEVRLPGFEEYVNLFIEHSEFEVSEQIEYPEFSEYGENILFLDKTVLRSETWYSMAADLPAGSALTVKLSGGLWHYIAMPEGPVNWDVSRYDDQLRSQTFDVIEPGIRNDLKISFVADTSSQSDTIQTTPIGNTVFVEYFENLSDTATRSKLITLE
ncbi:MAG: hypothetical protein KAT15_14595 [Bacteroidales bacterium]|nr:hypothetical protein [Bacteroidales bacterium]